MGGRMIQVGKPMLDGNEVAYVLDALRREQVSAGPYVERFEREFAQFVGSRFAVATTSGTTALHLALAGLGIGNRHEVIVPSLTFMATASAVAQTGARPVFVDVLPGSWTMDPGKVREAITERTRAIIPVHLYGVPAEMDELLGIAQEYHLQVVEDAAESLGSRYRGRMTGTLGKAGIFSFYGNKLITTGEGGMLVTDDRELAESAQELRNHGRPLARRSVVQGRRRAYWHERLGFNYRMMELQGALGVAQLERVQQRMEERRQLRALYEVALRGATLQQSPLGCDVVWWMNVALVNSPDLATEMLAQAGVETRPVFWPLDSLPVWGKRREGGEARRRGGGTAGRVFRLGVVLPTHGGVTVRDVELIAGVFEKLQKEILM